MEVKRSRRAVSPRAKAQDLADPDSTLEPSSEAASAAATGTSAAAVAIDHDELAAAILRFLRRFPNQTVDLKPLADELGLDPFTVQLEVEHLARRRMVVAPFIEPGTANGATLTEVGLRWLLAREGGSPPETPVALQPARERVRSEDEAARLPRAQVYGVKR